MLVLRGGGQHPGLGQRGDHRVVHDQHVRRDALLGREQYLAGQRGGVKGGPLDW